MATDLPPHPATEPVTAAPATEAGRRLLAASWLPDAILEHILAIEAEARAAALRGSEGRLREALTAWMNSRGDDTGSEFELIEAGREWLDATDAAATPAVPVDRIDVERGEMWLARAKAGLVTADEVIAARLGSLYETAALAGGMFEGHYSVNAIREAIGLSPPTTDGPTAAGDGSDAT